MIRSKFLLAAVLGVITINDLLSNGSGVGEASKDIPEPKFSKNSPSVQFLYCRVFEQYANILIRKYPDLSIHGTNYPPPSWKYTIAEFLGVGKIIVIIIIGLSLNPFEYLGIEKPGWFVWMCENKIFACFLVFFLSNAVETHLMSTGAFEISIGDVLVWSKLQSGRIPQPQELLRAIDNVLELNPTGGSKNYKLL